MTKIDARACSAPITAGSESPVAAAALPKKIVLREPPFDNTRDSNYFFHSSGHAEALSRMAYLIADRNMGIGLLTGEIGCGKTITSTVLRQQLKQGPNHVVSLENGFLDFDSLLLEIISQMRGERISTATLPDRYARMSAFKQTLMRRIVEKQRHLVILLDEAQQLETDAITLLKGLINIGSERQNFISLVFIGQPELRITIRSLAQVNQRVGLRYHLNALSLEETRRYLQHRLAVAGLQSDYPFEDAAVTCIYNRTNGVPREINRLCKLALEHAFSLGSDTISASIIEAVLKDLYCHDGLLEDEGNFP